MPASFEPWAIMNMPPGGFLGFGLVLLALAWWKDRAARRAAVKAVLAAPPRRRAAEEVTV
jgi:hypothetical protein